MTTESFIDIMNTGEPVIAGSPVFSKMHELSQEAIRLTLKLNTEYNTVEQIVDIMSRITGRKVPASLRLFPPFYTDCGKNIHFGERVFVNSGCKFQDQGGIYIGDDVLVGHNCVIATLNL